jgi:hypothetical protein
LTFNGLHSVVSHKIALFMTTAVRTSNPTNLTLLIFVMGMRCTFCKADSRSGHHLIGHELAGGILVKAAKGAITDQINGNYYEYWMFTLG